MINYLSINKSPTKVVSPYSGNLVEVSVQSININNLDVLVQKTEENTPIYLLTLMRDEYDNVSIQRVETVSSYTVTGESSLFTIPEDSVMLDTIYSSGDGILEGYTSIHPKAMFPDYKGVVNSNLTP